MPEAECSGRNGCRFRYGFRWWDRFAAWWHGSDACQAKPASGMFACSACVPVRTRQHGLGGGGADLVSDVSDESSQGGADLAADSEDEDSQGGADLAVESSDEDSLVLPCETAALCSGQAIALG